MKRPAICFILMLVESMMLVRATVVVAQVDAGPALSDTAIRYQALKAIEPGRADNFYRGANTCSGCHSGTGNFPADVLARVCLTEFTTWKNADRHFHAHASLEGERGQRIGKLLNKNVFDDSTGCVQCHSTATELPTAEEEGSLATRAILAADEKGVSCESCHGPSSRWLSDHSLYQAYPAWQNKSLAEKTDIGWIEVRSPVTRAEVCLSCHVGSAEHGRVITHAMYAAGHPPLAGFEIESFIDKMPRHWRHAHERTQPGAVAAAQPSFERTRNSLVASVVAVRMAVELAVADANTPGTERRWPELARLECFACHHELAGPGWRQMRTAATPGRPQLAVGCVPLVEVAAEVAGENVDAIMARLRAPFTANVFGDPAALAEQGGAVVAWCESLERRLADMDFRSEKGRKVALQALHRIAEQAANQSHDYDTARQLFGAWRVVYDELVANRAIQLSAADQKKLAGILERIDARDAFALERDRVKPPCDPPPAVDPTVAARQQEAVLDKAFINRANYNPATFSQVMRALGDLTGG